MCPKTCGKCGIELIVDESSGCFDIPADEEPILYHDGAVADCRLMQDQCADKTVQDKCKLTCQNCGEQIELLGPSFKGLELIEEYNPDKIRKAQTTTTLYPNLESSISLLRDQVRSGCQRRRRFGICGDSSVESGLMLAHVRHDDDQ